MPHSLQCQLYIGITYTRTLLYVILLWWPRSHHQTILLHCILHSYSTLSTVQPDGGHYRSQNMQLLALAIYATNISIVVLTTLYTVSYFDTHIRDAAPQRNGLWLHDLSRRPYLCTACAAPFFPSSSILHFPFYLPCSYLWPCSMCPMLDLVGCSSCILLWVWLHFCGTR